MIVLVSILTIITIASCVKKYKKTKYYISCKNCDSFKNHLIGVSEFDDYTVSHYMCKSKMFAYIHHKDEQFNYSETPEVTPEEKSNKKIVYATYVTPNDNNFQIVTKKVRKFAGLDGAFFNWDKVPSKTKRKVLKAPKNATHIRLVHGDGSNSMLSLKD